MMKRLLSRIFSLLLVASIFLVGCSASSTGLTGNYSEDTLAVVESLRAAIDIPYDSPEKADVQADAKGKINDYISRYRRDSKVSGSPSFLTMSTALNSLASHYNSAPNRPISDKLRKRLDQEFKQIEISLRRETAA